MLRPLAMIGTAGLMAMTISVASAQQASSCPNCDNGGAAAAPVYTTGTWQYADCEECDNGHCRGCHCQCTKSWPDKGWNAPARLPVNRDGIWYHNYWPQAWYGNRGGGFISDVPTVYQPTDTTQLGYSYAKVPTWSAGNHAIPPIPCPSRFHSRVCVPRPCAGRRCIDGCPTANPCQNGNCQSCQQGYAGFPTVPLNGQQVTMLPAGAMPIPAQQMNVTPQQGPIQKTSARQEQGLFSLATLKKMFD